MTADDGPDMPDAPEREPGSGKDSQPPIRRPFVYVRALLVAMPLAILVGSIVSPPDAVAQVILIAGSLIGGFPIAVRLVSARRYGPRQLGSSSGSC